MLFQKKTADLIPLILFMTNTYLISEKSWRSRDIPEDWKKVNSTPIYKSLKEDPENCRPISLNSVPGKVMERIVLGAIISQMKHMTGKSQHRFTKGKSGLTNLIAFCNKVTCLVDVRLMVDVVYLGLSQCFRNGFPQPPPGETDALQS